MHGRWPNTMTLSQLVKQFNKSLNTLPLHLFTAYKQWDACKTLFSNLANGEVATIEDYQQNQQVIMVILFHSDDKSLDVFC